jgi:tRNA(Leu) C34 or U34 (ribose-2'-O)-methylase TrmL
MPSTTTTTGPIHTTTIKDRSRHAGYAREAVTWLTIRDFKTTADCVAALKAEGRQIWTTELSQASEALVAEDDTAPPTATPGFRFRVPKIPGIALVMGTESSGVSKAMIDAADRSVYLPQHGFADSLNLSVAAALILQWILLHNKDCIGDMPDAMRQELRKHWYQKSARTKEQLVEHMSYIDKPIEPFADTRRPGLYKMEGRWRGREGGGFTYRDRVAQYFQLYIFIS